MCYFARSCFVVECQNGRSFIKSVMYLRFQSSVCRVMSPYFRMSMSIFTMLLVRARLLFPQACSICFRAMQRYSSLCGVCVNARQLRNLSDFMPIGSVHTHSVNMMLFPNMLRNISCACDMLFSWSQFVPSASISSLDSVMSIAS